MGHLIVLGRNIALLVKVLWTHLCDVHVNHVGVVAVDLHHLIRVLTIDIDVVVGANVLVRKNSLRLSELITGGIHVPELQVFGLLLLVNLEEEIFLGDNFIIGLFGHFFRGNLVFELDKTDFLLNNLVNSLADLFEVLGAASFTEFVESTRGCRGLL